MLAAIISGAVDISTEFQNVLPEKDWASVRPPFALKIFITFLLAGGKSGGSLKDISCQIVRLL